MVKLKLKLKEYREAAGLSQAELARRVGITRGRYNHYELGQRTADTETLLKIADELGVAVGDLLGVAPVFEGFGEFCRKNLAALPGVPLPRDQIIASLQAMSDDELRGVLLSLEAAHVKDALLDYQSGASSVNKSVKSDN